MELGSQKTEAPLVLADPTFPSMDVQEQRARVDPISLFPSCSANGDVTSDGYILYRLECERGAKNGGDLSLRVGDTCL